MRNIFTASMLLLAAPAVFAGDYELVPWFTRSGDGPGSHRTVYGALFFDNIRRGYYTCTATHDNSPTSLDVRCERKAAYNPQIPIKNSTVTFGTSSRTEMYPQAVWQYNPESGEVQFCEFVTTRECRTPSWRH